MTALQHTDEKLGGRPGRVDGISSPHLARPLSADTVSNPAGRDRPCGPDRNQEALRRTGQLGSGLLYP
jgi:hypothetical protein